METNSFQSPAPLPSENHLSEFKKPKNYVLRRSLALVLGTAAGYMFGFLVIPLFPSYRFSNPFTTGYVCAILGLFVGIILWVYYLYRDVTDDPKEIGS